MSRRPATARPACPVRSSQGCLALRQALRHQLREEILALPVPAFDRLIARLLQACGYQGVQVLGEAQSGGDLVACTSSGLSSTLTLVQAKQYVAPVSRRFVDELRGAMLRRGASQGLLLTTSAFYSPARTAAETACPLPVRLVEGEELLDLLLGHGLGVRPTPGGSLALDRGFFDRLMEEGCPGQAGQATPASSLSLKPCAMCGGHSEGDSEARSPFVPACPCR